MATLAGQHPVVVEFHGLRVNISKRVLEAWRKVPIEDEIALLEITSRAMTRFRYAPMRRALEKDIESRKKFRAGIGEAYLQKNVSDYDRIQLIHAYDKRDWRAIRRIAAQVEAQEKAMVKRPARYQGVEAVLLQDWFNRDGLCLAWFSFGALEALLRGATLWPVKGSVKALEKRVLRLGLKPLRPALINTKHLVFSGKTVGIS